MITMDWKDKLKGITIALLVGILTFLACIAGFKLAERDIRIEQEKIHQNSSKNHFQPIGIAVKKRYIYKL